MRTTRPRVRYLRCRKLIHRHELLSFARVCRRKPYPRQKIKRCLIIHRGLPNQLVKTNSTVLPSTVVGNGEDCRYRNDPTAPVTGVVALMLPIFSCQSVPRYEINVLRLKRVSAFAMLVTALPSCVL